MVTELNKCKMQLFSSKVGTYLVHTTLVFFLYVVIICEIVYLLIQRNNTEPFLTP